MTDLNLFDLNKPVDLYKIIHEVYLDYIKNPTEKDFLFLALGFTHLREWIAEGKLKDIKCKKQLNLSLTDGEKFFEEIYQLDEFKVIQGLCNKGKHFITSMTGKKPNTAKEYKPFTVESPVGDALNQMFFLIDGKDSRDYFFILIRKYNEWFSKHG